MQMQALKAHRYGTERRVGDIFEVRQADVRLMKALGWQTEAPPMPQTAAPTAEAKPKRTYTRKVIEPTPEAATEKAEAPKRTYHRRDLEAE